MIRTYALEPAVASDGMALNAFVLGLGVENGRLMGEFPRHWVRDAFEHLNKVSSVREQARITELLKRIRTDGLIKVRTGLPYDGEQAWLDNAIRHIESFDAVICADTTNDRPQHDRLHSASSLLNPPPYWNVERRVAFTASRDNLIALLQPLLKLETQVAIMDPYFNPRKDDSRRGLMGIASVLRANTSLVIHTSTKVDKQDKTMPIEQWTAACRDHLAEHVAGLASLVIVRWTTKSALGHPHERWVISPRGGIELGRGIAVGPFENTATLLPATTTSQLWAEYGQPPFRESKYALKDTVVI